MVDEPIVPLFRFRQAQRLSFSVWHRAAEVSVGCFYIHLPAVFKGAFHVFVYLTAVAAAAFLSQLFAR